MAHPIKSSRLVILASPHRITDIDAWRGMVIILMALDHSRDFFDVDALHFSATDLNQTYPILFLTRFVSHLCAPSFVFLAGISAFLSANRRSLSQTVIYLSTRGIWLILIDMLFISPMWTHEFWKFGLDTFSAIGFSLLALSLMLPFSRKFIFCSGLLITLLHNILDFYPDLGRYYLGQFWFLIHERGPLPFGLPGQVNYPIVPWIGLIFLGYGTGGFFIAPQVTWREQAKQIGFALLIIFVFIRYINIYGDPIHWRQYPSALMTLFSFINITKYPPSLDFILITMGFSLIGLSLMHLLKQDFYRILTVYGQSSFLFYVIHLYLLAALAIIVELFKGHSFNELRRMISSQDFYSDYGVGLFGAYIIWIIIVIALYPAMKYLGNIKKTRKHWFLSYI